MPRTRNQDTPPDDANVDSGEPGAGPEPGDETTTEAVPDAGVAPDAPPANEDVVAMASLRKDGTPDQTDGFRFIDEDAGREILRQQQESVGDAFRDAVVGNREESRVRGARPV